MPGRLAPCTPAGRLQLEVSELKVDHCSWLPDERRAASGFVLAELRPYHEAPQQADVQLAFSYEMAYHGCVLCRFP